MFGYVESDMAPGSQVGGRALDRRELRGGVFGFCCWATNDRNLGAGKYSTHLFTISQLPQV